MVWPTNMKLLILLPAILQGASVVIADGDTAVPWGAFASGGGFGLLSAVLFYLHTNSIKTSRAELKKERELFETTVQNERKIAADNLAIERKAAEDRHKELVTTLSFIEGSQTWKNALTDRIADKLKISHENPPSRR